MVNELNFVLLFYQITTHLVAESDTNLLPYSSQGHKSEMCLSRLNCRCWQGPVPF